MREVEGGPEWPYESSLRWALPRVERWLLAPMVGQATLPAWGKGGVRAAAEHTPAALKPSP